MALIQTKMTRFNLFFGIIRKHRISVETFLCLLSCVSKLSFARIYPCLAWF